MAKKKTLQLQVESEDLTVPQDRIEGFLAKAAGLVGTMPEGQFSRLERYLAIIAAGGGGGGAPIDSPTFTGVPKAPTAEKGTDTTQIATTEFVQTAIDDKQDTLNYPTADVNSYLAMVATANEVANGGVAPGGFGLGSYIAHILHNSDDLNTINKSGVYSWSYNDVPANGPGSIEPGCMLVLAKSGDEVTQIIYYQSLSMSGCSVSRTIFSSTVGAWEWLNPPMLEGVEYRTTERFLGKPVYQKIIGNVTFQDNQITTVPIGSDVRLVLDFSVIVRPTTTYSVTIKNSAYPDISSVTGGENFVTVHAGDGNIYIMVNGNPWTNESCIAWAKYTKATG